MPIEPRYPCAKCGKRTTEEERTEAYIFDLPPCCSHCHESVSGYVMSGIGMWPVSWRGGYYWSKDADCFLIHGNPECKWWERVQ